MTPLRLATVWLDGCSGCHMSLLDMDARLLELAQRVQIVYSPLIDVKQYPDKVDIACVEGAVSTSEDLSKLRVIRQRTTIVIAMGDCAVTGNVPALRNTSSPEIVMNTVYSGLCQDSQLPSSGELPHLLAKALPLHHHVSVDHFLPGCPPSADVLFCTLMGLIEGQGQHLKATTRFGA